MPTFFEMKPRYSKQWAACKINASWQDEADACVRKITANRGRYEAAQRQSGLWWPVIACIHAMESSFSFSGHLHNGDSLKARTWQVPAGRPRAGTPPFTWEESAADALSMKRAVLDGLEGKLDTPEECLYYLENYNGWGYQTGAGRNSTPPSSSPYLWSGTNQWVRGKYVADGRFDAAAGSSQFGVAGILKSLELAGLITFGAIEAALPAAEAKPYAPAEVPAPEADGERVLRYGQKSEHVRWLIAALMGLGYLAKDDETTDVFNSTVQDVVIWFQGKAKLEVDGVVGLETRAEIGRQLLAARGKPVPPKPQPSTDFSKVIIERGAPSLKRPLWQGLVPILVTIGDKQWVCASGQSWAQDFDVPWDPGSLPGNMEPIPQGEYRLGDIDWANGVDNYNASHGHGLGAAFIPIVAAFADDRGAFGFHVDANIDGSPGSAGCVVFYTVEELRSFIAALRAHNPRACKVDWKL